MAFPRNSQSDYLAQTEEARLNIATAIEVYNFFEQVDKKDVTLLQNELGSVREDMMVDSVKVIRKNMWILCDGIDTQKNKDSDK